MEVDLAQEMEAASAAARAQEEVRVEQARTTPAADTRRQVSRAGLRLLVVLITKATTDNITMEQLTTKPLEAATGALNKL